MADNMLPFDYQSEIDQQTRRRQLAEMMLKQSMQPIQMQQGRIASKISPLAIMAQVAGQTIGASNLAEADAAISGTRQKYATDERNALQAHLAQPLGARINSGLASPYAGVRATATKDQELANKRLEKEVEITATRDPDRAIGVLKGMAVSQEPLKDELVVVNGQIVPKKQADLRDKFEKPKVIPGAPGTPGILVQEGPGGKIDAIDKAPKVSATASAQGGAAAKAENEFVKGIAGLNVEEYKGARKAAQSSQALTQMVKQMRELDSKGVFGGPAAPAQIVLAGLAKQFNVPLTNEDFGKLANSEAFQRQFANQIAKVMLDGSVGRSMTDPDRKRFEETLPNLAQSPAARAQIYAQLEAEAANNFKRYNSMSESLARQYPEANLSLGLNPVDMNPGIGTPPNSTASVPGAPTKPNGRKGKDAKGRPLIAYPDGSWEYTDGK